MCTDGPTACCQPVARAPGVDISGCNTLDRPRDLVLPDINDSPLQTGVHQPVEMSNMCADKPFAILVLAGSYRTDSYNQALVAGAREMAPSDIEIHEFDLRRLPHYDGDVEATGDPDPVAALKDEVREADALLIVTPEYNSGVPGVLKNAIDWISRTYPDAPIGGKIAAIVGATPGRSGTRFAQEHLRQVLDRTGATVIGEPQLLVARAGDVIKNGMILSEDLKVQLQTVLETLVETGRHCEATGSAAVAN